MKRYEYKIFRYCPDLTTGEFVNLGIIIFSPDLKYLGFEGISKFQRITDFFTGVNGYIIRKIIRHVNNKVIELDQRFKNEFPFEEMSSLDVIVKKLVPVDDSSLSFSGTNYGITLDIEKTLRNLFCDIVLKFEIESVKKSRSDEDAWKLVYKEYFNKYNLTSVVQKQVVKTKRDKFEFEGWKNGRWHYYKPISFDLVEKESIKEKVYKWSGMLKELSTSNKDFNLYLMALEPKHDKSWTISFVKEVLEDQNENMSVKIIRESEFDNFVRVEKEEMEKHDL